MLPCAALADPAGPAFSFSACPWLFSPTPHQGETKPGFSHLGSPLPFNSSTTGSHSFNGTGNPFCWCHFPTLASKSQTGSHTGFSLFGSCSSYLSPTGKGWPALEFGLSRLSGFAHNRLTRLQQGRFGALLVSFPLPALENRTQGHTGAGLGFTSVFWRAFALAALPSPAPA